MTPYIFIYFFFLRATGFYHAGIFRIPAPDSSIHIKNNLTPRFCSNGSINVFLKSDGRSRNIKCYAPSASFEIPPPSSKEILRIELKKVPASHVSAFLKRWGGCRVPNRPDVATPGIPRTNMPVTTELKESKVGESSRVCGLKLYFDASPTDSIEIDVYPLQNDASAIIMTRSGESRARTGSLGPQIFSLIEDSENIIKRKLQVDTNSFAKEFSTYHLENGNNAESDKEALLSDTAFPGGEKYSDVVDSYPGGRNSFERDVFNAFENFRMMDDFSANTNRGIKGLEGVLTEMRAQNATDSQLIKMFQVGYDLAVSGKEDQLKISPTADLLQLEVILSPKSGLKGGIDIFSGPPTPAAGRINYINSLNDFPNDEKEEKLYTMYDEDDVAVLQISESEFERIDPDKLELEMARLDGLLYELGRAPPDMRHSILREYADVLLDEYYILSMRARIPRIETEEMREIMQQVNAQAISLVEQLALMKQAQEIQELEKIRVICEVAIDDMSKLPDRVRSMKPLLKGDFVAYLVYAIDKERALLKRNGLDPDREPSRWLQVLGLIKKGVYAELEKDVHLDIQAIHYVLRMHTKEERRKLLETTISTLPSMDVRNFKRVAENIVWYISSRENDSTIEDSLKQRVAELGEFLEELLPDSRVKELSREVDEWAAKRVADRDAILQLNQKEGMAGYDLSEEDILRMAELQSQEPRVLAERIMNESANPSESSYDGVASIGPPSSTDLDSNSNESDTEDDNDSDGWEQWDAKDFEEISSKSGDLNEEFDDNDIMPGLTDRLTFGSIDEGLDSK